MPAFLPRVALLGLSLPLLLAGAAVPVAVAAQQPATVTLAVRVLTDTLPVPEALVRVGGLVRITDGRGVARLVLAPARHRVSVLKLGYAPESLLVELAPGRDTTVDVQLQPRAARLERTIVSSARTDRALADEPLRIEVVSGEEVVEKMQQRPGDLRGVLGELTGLHVQTSAPGLGPTYARIQGMRGRYTLFLTDGLPIWGAGSEGFEILQITPIDVAQVEAITGPASALYGPGALGGVIDLVSRRPPAVGEAREVLVSQTSREGSDAAVWEARRFGDRWGMSLLGGIHYQTRNDLDDDGWADLPQTRRGEIRPRLYWTGANGSTVYATASAMGDSREGGDEAQWPMSLRTRRADAGVVARIRTTPTEVVTVRLAGEHEWRRRLVGTVGERERRDTEMGELSWAHDGNRSTPLVGVAIQRDALRALDVSGFDYGYVVPSVFAQETWRPVDRLALALSARTDVHSEFGTVTSPRASVLVRLTPDWSMRATAASGYFAPVPLTEETEETGLRYVAPLGDVGLERARHGALDVTGSVGAVRIAATAFATRVANPLSVRTLAPTAPGEPPRIQLENAGEPLRARGAELLVGWQALDGFDVTATYARVHATELDLDTGRRRGVPLTPGHTAELDVAWASEARGRRIAVELVHVGEQELQYDPYRRISRPYATVGVLAQQRFGGAVLFVNGENLGGVRQTRWESLRLPVAAAGGRLTSDVWAPLEGCTVNAGVRVAF